MDDIQVDVRLPRQLVPSLLHAGVQSITRLTLKNLGVRAFGPAQIGLSIPELSAEPVRVPIPAIGPSEEESLSSIPLPLGSLDHFRLLSQQHRDDGLPCQFDVALDNGDILASQRTRVLPPNAWAYEHHPDVLAAFVQKENRAVTRVRRAALPFLRTIEKAANFAEAADLPLALYPKRTKHIIQALYEALRESFQIHCVREIRTPDPVRWQKIRFHDRVLADREGTCIDLALLLMACLESVHLDPLLVIVRTGPALQHALVACWQDGNLDRSAVIRKRAKIADRLTPPTGAGQLVLVDPRGFTTGYDWPFSEACREALRCFAAARHQNFVYAVNIARTRVSAGKRRAISPMPFGEGPNLNAEGWAIVQGAEDAARHFRYDIVERAHLFLAVLESARAVSRDVFGHPVGSLIEQTRERLRKKSPEKGTRIVWHTKSLQKTVQQAGSLAEEIGCGLIGPVELLLALLHAPGQTVTRVLTDLEIDRKAAMDQLAEIVRGDPRRESYVDFKSSHPDGEL